MRVFLLSFMVANLASGLIQYINICNGNLIGLFIGSINVEAALILIFLYYDEVWSWNG